MAKGAVGVGEHGRGDLAHQRVPEDVLALARKARHRARADDLSLDQRAQRLADLHPARLTAAELEHAGLPERLAEDAAGAHHPARLRRQALQARLHHGQHGVRQRVALALRHRADQLLQVEGVALRALHDARHRLRPGSLTEHLAHQLLARLAGQLQEAHLQQPALLPEAREELAHLGTRHGQHHEGSVLQSPQRALHELHRGQVAPVQVLEHQQQRRGLALRGHPVLPGAAHLVAHQPRVLPGGAQLHAPPVLVRHAGELAQELGDAARVLAAKVTRHAGRELLLPHTPRLAVEDAHGASGGHGQHGQRRAGGHRVAARHPHLHALAALLERRRMPIAGGVGGPVEFTSTGGEGLSPLLGLEPAQQLEAHPRLAGAGGGSDQHRARHRLGAALLEDGRQGAELALAPHRGRGSPEQGARPRGLLPLATQEEPIGVAADVEALVEQPRGRLVEADAGAALAGRLALGAGALEHLDRALDDVADRHGGLEHALAGGHYHRRIAEVAAHRQRAARSACTEIGGRAGAGQHHHHRAVGEEVEHALPDLRGVAQRAQAWPEEGGDGRRAGARLGAHAIRFARRVGARHHAGVGEARQHQAHHPALGAGQRGGRRGVVGARRRARLGQRPQGGGHCPGVGGPIEGLLGEHPRHQRVELGRHLGRQPARPRGLLEHHLEEDGQRVAAGERRAPGEAAVEDAAQGEDVGAHVDLRFTARLLRGHEARRAHEHPRPRQAAVARLAADEAGDAEVQDLRATDVRLDQHHVARLEIAVDDAALVQHLQRLGDALRQAHALADAHPATRQPRAQRLALQPLHGQPGQALVGEPVGHVADDARVAEPGEHRRLAREAHRVLVALDLEDLDGHHLAALPIARAIDVAHAARAGAALDLEPLHDDGAREHDPS
ncbi:MAG: hypothetical protein WKG00_25585 [Polyangiaceae bacterium]